MISAEFYLAFMALFIAAAAFVRVTLSDRRLRQLEEDMEDWSFRDPPEQEKAFKSLIARPVALDTRGQ
jgi:hypothetical protein